MAVSLGDLSRAIDLNAKYDALHFTDDDQIRPSTAVTPSTAKSSFGLGDLSSIWTFLGTPPPPATLELSPPASPLAAKSVTVSNNTPRKSSKSTAEKVVRPALLNVTPAKKPKSQTKVVVEAVVSNTHVPRATEAKKDNVQNAAPAQSKTDRPKTPVTSSKSASKLTHAPTTPAKATIVEQAPVITWEQSQAVAAQQQDHVTKKIERLEVNKFLTPAKPSIGLLPSSVPPLAGGGKPITPEARPRFTASRSFHNSSTPRSIQPRTARSLEDKDWDLYLRIIQNFPLDKRTLVAPMNLTTHNHDPAGIHVFVDASNIFIGFLKAMKLARGIPEHARIPRADLSFDGLALLMERRRPVAKRVLVGSTPHLPAFDTAASVGYQCSILEKVEKQRKLTERQIFFKEQEESRRQGLPFPSSNRSKPSSRYAVSGGGNTSDSANLSSSPPQYAKLAKVEQGVDEILHLKICESVLDNPGRPGTIVLATGDAAEAEYSDGFLRTIERALEHGWKVELMSWRKSISALYKRREWRGRWEDRFRIVELDEYAEDLLDLTACSGFGGEDRGAESA